MENVSTHEYPLDEASPWCESACILRLITIASVHILRTSTLERHCHFLIQSFFGSIVSALLSSNSSAPCSTMSVSERVDKGRLQCLDCSRRSHRRRNRHCHYCHRQPHHSRHCCYQCTMAIPTFGWDGSIDSIGNHVLEANMINLR
jgi:hypothetical protein